MAFVADPRVDAYIDALPDWQQAICREVRELAHAADPEVSETIKRTRQPYFVLQISCSRAMSAPCWRRRTTSTCSSTTAASSPDPEGIITAGHDNNTARTVAFRQGETVNAPVLTAMFRQIIANNRAGGWRKLKRQSQRGG